VSDAKKFKPKALGRESVEAPMEPHWKVMGPKAEKELHAKAQAQHRRFQTFAPLSRRRLLLYVPGTAAGFAFLAWFFLRASLQTLAIFGAVGAVLGAAVAWFRPLDFTAGALYMLAGLLGAFLLGTQILMSLLFGMLSACVGLVIGRAEEWKRYDGE